jgi:uncharacterized protein
MTAPAEGPGPVGAEAFPEQPWISILVLQPSPFCNIDCDYCYLPDRTSTRRMAPEVLRAAVQKTYASGLVRDSLSLIWHAGEPLAVPISWYENAFATVRDSAPPDAKIQHSFQSNGTLITQKWCDFIKAHRICIGLSIDGPAVLHDAHRKTRTGRGTHAEAVRGLRLLRANDIPFHVIAVVTRDALGEAEAIYDFFEAEGVDQLGFNIEEEECGHTASSLRGAQDDRVRAFYETLFRRQKERGTILIREFDSAEEKIRSGCSLRNVPFPWVNEQVRPFGIVSVDCAGNFSTYSPELLGMTVEPYGPFAFGNVLADDFADALESEKFRAVFRDVQEGLTRCAATCAYYGYCGGGAPANKYYENGTFASTETMYCRYSVQMPLDIVLAEMERDLQLARPSP